MREVAYLSLIFTENVSIYSQNFRWFAVFIPIYLGICMVGVTRAAISVT